jgi:hypothetical protein
MKALSVAALTVILGLALVPVAARAESRTYEFDAFEKLDISSGIDAIVTVGGEQSVRAESQNVDLDELILDVRDGTLFASAEWDDPNIFDLLMLGTEHEIVLHITVPAMTAVTASSGSDTDVTGMKGAALAIAASSGSDLTLKEIETGTLNLKASSGSDVDLSGTCDTATIDLSSGSDLTADELQCANVAIEASSASDAKVFASASIDAKASSGSDIEILGSPTDIIQEASSGADIEFD